jgi:hypothetical protein
MVQAYKNKKHEKQANEFIIELGKFVISFERICESMRYAVVFMFQSQGLKNQNMAYAVVGDKSSAELQVLVGALFAAMPNQDDDDRKAIKTLLKRIKDITEKRNLLLHNTWNLGESESWGAEILAVAVRFRTKQNTGASIEPHGINPSYLRELRKEMSGIHIFLQRLLTCLIQPKFKVSTEFNKNI